MIELYAILEISKSSTFEEIKAAYREKAKEFHPDKCPGDTEAVHKFRQIQEAYDILSDLNKRAAYDNGTLNSRGRQQSRSSKPRPDPFKQAWENSAEAGERGRNVQINVSLSLEETLDILYKNIVIPVKIPCKECAAKGFTEWAACSTCSGSGKAYLNKHPFNIFEFCKTCKGTGRSGVFPCETCRGDAFIVTGEKTINVKIPVGVDTGSRIKVPGQGDLGKKGGKPGDIELVIVIKPHEFYTRKGSDLHSEVFLNYSDFVLGKNHTIKSIEGNDVVIIIPPITSPGTSFRIKRLGIPDWTGKQRGDIIVKTILKMPVKTDKNHTELLLKLKDLENENH